MDESFADDERLYRAVYPPSYAEMYWRKDGQLSSAAFADRNGLSVDRGFYREPEEVVADMKTRFSGCIISFSVENCREVNAIVKYMPSKNDVYHTQVHSSNTTVLLNKSQRRHLAQVAYKEYIEN